MPNIVSIGTAVPPFIATQEDAKEFATNLYGDAYKGNLERLVSIFENTLIEKRHFCVPVEWFANQKSFEEKNKLYIENAILLSEASITRCMEKSNVSISEVDYLMFVSTTGLSTPSLDARLIDRLPFKKTVRRLPLWGLGCAGGAASLSWARTILTADKQATVLIVITELCGLTFVHSDLSKAALISSALFSDGSASILLQGEGVSRNHGFITPSVISSQTITMPDSLGVMGWRFNENGFNVVLSQNVPTIVDTFLKGAVEDFLLQHGFSLSDISYFITHPGGAKVLEAYKAAFGLTDNHLLYAYQVLKEFGNMSASTVIFILEKFIESHKSNDKHDWGLLAALGPGFSAELVMLKWGRE